MLFAVAVLDGALQEVVGYRYLVLRRWSVGRFESFAGQRIPFLACRDIAVFKVFFDRTQDWADLEQMAAAGTLDTDTVAAVTAAHVGPHDPRIHRLRSLTIST